MNLTKELLDRIQQPDLTEDDRALLRCQLAKQFEDAGNYEGAVEALGELWCGLGDFPKVDLLLDPMARATVLLRVGTLTGWIGSTRQMEGSQEAARNMLTQSDSLFQQLRLAERAAEARIELAYCYWREGAFNEARTMLHDAVCCLDAKHSDLKAVAMLRLAVVEGSSKRLNDALTIYKESAPLFEISSNLALKGKFHHGFAFVLRNLAASEGRPDYLDRALIECSAASYYFEQAGLSRYHACVENNMGFLFGSIRKFMDAHEHLDRAQTLFTTLKDNVHLAQVDETRARVLLAEGRIVEAEKTVRSAVRMLEQGDEQSLLAEALTTHGIAQARLQHPEQSRLTLERALETAERAGDLESAGNAALVLIEELENHVPLDELKSLVDRSRELLANTQDLSTARRLANCAARVLARVHATPHFPAKVDWTNFSFRKALLEYEAHFINLALEDTGGVVSRAARLLGFNHHQSLLALLNGRHEILRQRSTPIVRRRRSIIQKPLDKTKGSRKTRKNEAADENATNQ